MTAKEVAEYLTNECNPDAIVLMDVEASALYEEVFEHWRVIAYPTRVSQHQPRRR